MLEIWRHVDSGERYLVVIVHGVVSAAAGPLSPWEDPRWVLETRGNQRHNAQALLHMRRWPGEYLAEYRLNEKRRATPI
jgi:hypothetical protein